MRHKIKKLKRNNKKIFESSLTVNKNKDILRFLKREPLFVLKVKKKTCVTSYVTTLTLKRK